MVGTAEAKPEKPIEIEETPQAKAAKKWSQQNLGSYRIRITEKQSEKASIKTLHPTNTIAPGAGKTIQARITGVPNFLLTTKYF